MHEQQPLTFDERKPRFSKGQIVVTCWAINIEKKILDIRWCSEFKRRNMSMPSGEQGWQYLLDSTNKFEPYPWLEECQLYTLEEAQAILKEDRELRDEDFEVWLDLHYSDW